MKKKFENWLAMYKAILTVFANFSSSWESSQAFADSVTSFRNKEAAIESLRSKSESRTNGITKEKEIIQEKLVEQTYGIVVILKAYFTKTNNNVSFSKVNSNKSKLERLRENQLVAAAKDTTNIARENLEALADYKITEPIVNELETTISEFESKLSSPRITIGERKVAIKELEGLFKEINAILSDETDRMIVPYEKTDPDFYNAYMNAREVVKYGIRHEKEDKQEQTKTE